MLLAPNYADRRRLSTGYADQRFLLIHVVRGVLQRFLSLSDLSRASLSGSADHRNEVTQNHTSRSSAERTCVYSVMGASNATGEQARLCP